MEHAAEELIEGAAPAAVTVVKQAGWRDVPRLEAEELLSEHELERLVTWQEWGPFLALPNTAPRHTLRPSID